MKKLCLLFVLFSNYLQAQVNKGDVVPNIYFSTILNARVKNARISDFKGKIVVLEFWATWCGACIEAMPHLNLLQQSFPDQLRVITITDETEKRTGLFIKFKPSAVWFDVDTSGLITQFFPHQLIPHAVLISTDGRLIANTSPELITKKVIDSLLNGDVIHLADKHDGVLDYQQIIKTNFFAADTIQHRFMMLPQIKGAPGVSTIYLDNAVFSGRRLTAINLDLVTLYQIANKNFPYSRTIDQTKTVNRPAAYCLDIIVARKEDLLPILRNELSKRFDLQARIEHRTKEAYLLKICDTVKFKKLPVNLSGKRTYYSRHGEIDQQNITMDDLANYLESYGTGKPVFDETKSGKKFDIKFSFQPEDPESLTNTLSGIGLKLEKTKRDIEMLVISTSAKKK